MNIAIISVLVRAFCKPWLAELEANYPTPQDKLEAVRNAASDEGNDEILTILDWVERNKLTRTLFPETEEITDLTPPRDDWK